MKKTYLVDVELPNSGMSESVADYRNNLMAKGYNWYQSIGSLGGISGRSATISNGKVTRN